MTKPWDYESHMKAVSAKLLIQYGVPFAEILDAKATTYQGGYCETCEYTAAGVDITYRETIGGKPRYKSFEMSFSDLMKMEV